MNRYYVYLPSGGYDARGNIKKMYRRGSLNNTNSYSYIDLMTYTYVPNSNQLQRVAEATSSNYLNNGFKSKTSGTGYYTYDVNGNLKTDQHKEITDITYNHLNLPSLITFSNNRSIAYIYDAAGKKLRKTVLENGAVIEQKDYCDGIEYNGTGQTLEAIYHTEGRVKYQGGTIPWQYEYTLKDHLGNARVTFKADLFKNGTTQKANENDIIQENSYYPFGMAHVQPYAYATQGLENKYQYNGKELNGDFGLDWMDFGFRWYDPAIARFTGVDPIASDFPWVNPFNYAENEPIANIDFHGLQKLSIKNIKDESGNVVSRQVNVNVKMQMINLSSREGFMFRASNQKAETAAKSAFSASFNAKIVEKLSSGLSDNEVPVNVKFNLEIKEATLLSNVSDFDFVAIVVDKVGNTEEGGNAAGWGALNSNLMMLEVDQLMSKDGKELILHELGHNFGLEHTKDGHGLMGEIINGSTKVATPALKDIFLGVGAAGFKGHHIKHGNTHSRAKDFLNEHSKKHDDKKASNSGF